MSSQQLYLVLVTQICIPFLARQKFVQVLSPQKHAHFCRDYHTVVATNTLLSRQLQSLSRQTHFCRDKQVCEAGIQKCYLWQLPPMISCSILSFSETVRLNACVSHCILMSFVGRASMRWLMLLSISCMLMLSVLFYLFCLHVFSCMRSFSLLCTRWLWRLGVAFWRCRRSWSFQLCKAVWSATGHDAIEWMPCFSYFRTWGYAFVFVYICRSHTKWMPCQ